MLKMKKNTIYRFMCPDDLADFYVEKYGLRKFSRVLCLGEIKNKPGYYVFANQSGRVIWDLDGHDFEPLDA